MKIRSSHLLDNLSNCLMNLKNSGDSTGFEPMTSAMLVQCSNQLSYKVTQLRAGQFVGHMFSHERNVVWKKCYMKCGVWNQMKILSSHLLDNLSNCLRWLNRIRAHDLCDAGDFVAQLVRALHRRGHGFESLWVTWIFQVHDTIA